MRFLTFCTAALLMVCSAGIASADNVPAQQIFVKSVVSVDQTNHTATFPLFRGTSKGQTVWYILTDTSDRATAKARGLVFAPALANLGHGIVEAKQQGGVIDFPAAPDFTPTREYVASEGGFPPKSAKPGAVASDDYSPFIQVAGTHAVLNAPIIATGVGTFDVLTHTNTADRVVAVDSAQHTVTLALARGFADGKSVYYISTEASDPVAAAVERATYAPRLAKASSAATIPLGVIVNGALDGANAQGLAYLSLRTPLGADATLANAAALSAPFNILAQVPDLAAPLATNGYSPLWNAEAGAWTAAAIANHTGKKLTSFADLIVASNSGTITGPGGKPFGPAGFVVNCPAISLFTAY